MIRRWGIALAALALLSPATARGLVEDGAISSCFVPGDPCGHVVAREVAAAHKSLAVMAYNFTDAEIGAAIVAAHARGVAVQVILDKISPCQRGAQAAALAAAGVPIWIDWRVRIAHNKVLIVDGQAVLEGSFNFSASAMHNAENTNILRSAVIAAAYQAQFDARRAASRPFAGGVAGCRVKPAG